MRSARRFREPTLRRDVIRVDSMGFDPFPRGNATFFDPFPRGNASTVGPFAVVNTLPSRSILCRERSAGHSFRRSEGPSFRSSSGDGTVPAPKSEIEGGVR